MKKVWVLLGWTSQWDVHIQWKNVIERQFKLKPSILLQRELIWYEIDDKEDEVYRASSNLELGRGFSLLPVHDSSEMDL